MIMRQPSITLTLLLLFLLGCLVSQSLAKIHRRQHGERHRLHSLDALSLNPDQPPRQFFEGLYQGFNFTPEAQTLQRINSNNLNLTQLDATLDVLGEGLIYPEKLPIAVLGIKNYFSNLNNTLQPLDMYAQYIVNQFILAFNDEQTFKDRCSKSFLINEISPLLYFWDVQDLFPYGMFQDYGSAMARTLQLMIFNTDNSDAGEQSQTTTTTTTTEQETTNK